jgi:hypothetical protein
MAVNDVLFDLERELAKYPGVAEDDFANRRLILRCALNRQRAEGHQEGYADALRDTSEARVLAEAAQRDAQRKDAELGAFDGAPSHG